MENKRRKTVKAFLLAGLTVCLIVISQAYIQSVQHRVQQEVLRDMIVETNMEYSAANVGVQKEISVSVLENQSEQDAENSGGETAGEPDAENGGGGTVNEPQMLERYADLYEENKDLVGWLSIEDTKIDYPVMQNEDAAYYLHHDFYGQDSKYGCLYVKGQADLNTGTNFIIYGHNMKDGSMFGELDLYLKESFY